MYDGSSHHQEEEVEEEEIIECCCCFTQITIAVGQKYTGKRQLGRSKKLVNAAHSKIQDYKWFSNPYVMLGLTVMPRILFATSVHFGVATARHQRIDVTWIVICQITSLMLLMHSL